MTPARKSLEPLDPEFVNQLYKRAKANEAIFRNILVDISKSYEKSLESVFYRELSLESIFDEYVDVSGDKKRVSDFRVGAFVSDDIPYQRFPNFDPTKLKDDEALVLIEKSNDSWLYIHQVLEDYSVKPTKLYIILNAKY